MFQRATHFFPPVGTEASGWFSGAAVRLTTMEGEHVSCHLDVMLLLSGGPVPFYFPLQPQRTPFESWELIYSIAVNPVTKSVKMRQEDYNLEG